MLLLEEKVGKCVDYISILIFFKCSEAQWAEIRGQEDIEHFSDFFGKYEIRNTFLIQINNNHCISKAF